MIERILNRLESGDRSIIDGTDLFINLPIRQELINHVLADGAPEMVHEIRLTFLAANRAVLHLEVDAPVVGRTRRELSLRIDGNLDPFGQNPLDFVILDGFKLFDKPIIKLAGGIIEEKLPAGIDLTSKKLRVDVGQLLTGMGYAYMLPLVKSARVESHPEELRLLLHIKAEA